jgi:hypothetical protein
MISYTFLAPVAMAFIVFGVLASLVALGVLTEFFVSNRRERLARQESARTHYRRLVLTH